jgi:hypothetical protein
MPAPLRLALLLLSALLAACVATPQASSPEDAAAKRFEPVPGQGVLYVYRFSFNSSTPVLRVSGNTMGEFLPGTYFRIPVPPGDQVVQGEAGDNGIIRLNVTAGSIGYVRNDVSGTPGAVQSQFVIVPAAEAQGEILRCCTLLENYAPGQRRLLY